MTIALKSLCLTTSLLLTTFGAPLGAQAQAETTRDQARFDLVMLGLTAGSVTFSAEQTDSAYAVTGRLETAGAVAFLKKVSYDARSAGTVTGGTYVPSRYSEKADTGERQSEAVMEYVDGVPQVKSYNPPRKARKSDINPATQGGTVDPLTALYATLRDVAPGEECKISVPMFDGRRASRLSLSAPVRQGDSVTCQGEYRRVAGFSKSDMKKKTSFPFSLTYTPTADGKMRVTEIEMDTLYGQARLIRQ